MLTTISGTGFPDYRVVYQHNHDWTKTNMNTIHGRFLFKKCSFNRDIQRLFSVKYLSVEKQILARIF